MTKSKAPQAPQPNNRGTDPIEAKSIARSRAMINRAVGGPAGNISKPAMPPRSKKAAATPKSMRVD